jgi:flagellar motor switch protein FliM
MAASENAVAAETTAAAEDGDAAAMNPAANAISEEEVSALLEKNQSGGVRPYDLTTQRINRTQLPMLEIVAKSFADRISISLSNLLGRDAAVQFTALDTAKAGDLQATLTVPASLAIVRLKPLPGFAFIMVEPALLLALLDGFFGGSGRATSDLQSAIAPAAQRFLALMLRSSAADWSAAFTPVAPVEFELVKQETNPRLMQLGGPQDGVIALKFAVEFGAHSGRIDCLLPEEMLAPIREALASDGATAHTARKHEAWGPFLGLGLQEAELETRAVLAEAEISLRELVQLTPGDVIPIDAPQHVTLLAGEVPLYRGRFGVSQGRNALKIIPAGTA